MSKIAIFFRFSIHPLFRDAGAKVITFSFLPKSFKPFLRESALLSKNTPHSNQSIHNRIQSVYPPPWSRYYPLAAANVHTLLLTAKYLLPYLCFIAYFFAQTNRILIIYTSAQERANKEKNNVSTRIYMCNTYDTLKKVLIRTIGK